ncbi:MAG TPA: acetyl-CoA carboxylase biotin carboxyl carrier protein [Blastocatellia bacterium]|nr:acetyl-CoA carboxylase biotin carboxyl carrier protein [Blastocatellia bacterium]
MKLKEIKALIELIDQKGFADFEIENKGFRLRIRRYSESPLSASPTPLIISSPIGGELPPRRAEQRTIEVQLSEATKQAQPDAPAAAVPPQAPPEPEPQRHTIKSPIVGTFYRSPSPTAAPFVQIGDRVQADSVVCIIEAMKLMNEIQAEVSGEILAIHVENGQPVEYGQPLFEVKV